MRRFLVLALLALALVGVVAACGGGEEVSPVPEEVQGTTTAEEQETGEEETTEEETGEETGEEETGGDAEAGADVWNANGCGGCHVLAAANSSGTVGPNLDESKPDAELVVDRVTNGQGVMPAFGDQLSEQQIADVAAYVVESTSG